MKYTINSINGKQVIFTIKLDDETEVNQVVNGMPTEDVLDLKRKISEYCQAFKTGRDIEKAPEVDIKINDLIAKEQTVGETSSQPGGK